MTKSSIDNVEFALMMLAVILLTFVILISVFESQGVDCRKPENRTMCSALSDMAFVIYPTGHAIETTLYEDENGTLTEVTRDLGEVTEK